jgi:hypothetical protein
MKSLEECFKSSSKYSLKYSNYFEIYESLLSRHRGKRITLVEVGVFHGGSLFMWRDYFGDNARIIGIEADPNAIELAKDGFEIYIGDSKDPNFWSVFYEKVGKIDVLIDDAGHTNAQQSQALISSIENMNDKGLIIIEDAYQSYSKDFGNPSPFSFIQLSKLIVNRLMTRTMKSFRSGNLAQYIWSICYFERMVVFELRESNHGSDLVNNNMEKRIAFDYRHNDNNFFLKAVKGLDDLLNLKFESIGNRYRFFRPLNHFIKSGIGRKFLRMLSPLGKIVNLLWFGTLWLRNLGGWRYFRKFK